MSSAAWLPGRTARFWTKPTDAAGVAVDPVGLVLKVKAPDGTITSYAYGAAPEVVRDGVGQYHADIVLTTAGLWSWRWEAGPSTPDAAEGVINVQKSRF